MNDHLRFNNKTGATYSYEEVREAHKRGLLCLRCGKYVSKLLCDECAKFERCELCTIVCRPIDTYKVYRYHKISKGTYEEFYDKVIPFCKSLVDGLCETCTGWEEKIKNQCAVCDKKFLNSYKNYRENGNCCVACSHDIDDVTKKFDKNLDSKGNPNYLESYPQVELCENKLDDILNTNEI